MKTILIPVDFKCDSNEAIEYAIHLFKNETCIFYFLNTYSFNISGLNALNFLQADEAWYKKPQVASEKELAQLVYKYTNNTGKKQHKFYALSECESLVKGIQKTIDKLDIDLVVMSGKTETPDNIQEYATNTRKIIENIRKCPLIIVPDNATLDKNYEFILASNFEVEISESEIKNWCELVTITNGTFKVVVLSDERKMTEIQIKNHKKALLEIEKTTSLTPKVAYFSDVKNLKEIFRKKAQSIICLIDRKPNLWRKYGIAKSKIINLKKLSTT